MISITLSHYTRELPLGRFLSHPHINASWYASRDETRIYHFLDGSTYESFTLPKNSRRTRRPKYLRDGLPPPHVRKSDLKLASVLVSPEDDSVKLLSVALQPAPNISTAPTVLEALCAGPNTTLWDDFACDGDGWWIADALLDGTLRMVSDG